MATLTEQMVLQKARLSSLEQMKHLNFWGSDLADVSVIRRMPNLEVVSLSVNKLSTLRDLAACPHLTEVYIRKNEIATLTELRHLQQLTGLRTLWLSHNPCAECRDYRLRVIKMLPGLTKLDNSDVTQEERAQAAALPDCDSEPTSSPAAEQQQPKPRQQLQVAAVAEGDARQTAQGSVVKSRQSRGGDAFVIPLGDGDAKPIGGAPSVRRSMDELDILREEGSRAAEAEKKREPATARPSTRATAKPTRASSAIAMGAAPRRASWQQAISVIQPQSEIVAVAPTAAAAAVAPIQPSAPSPGGSPQLPPQQPQQQPPPLTSKDLQPEKQQLDERASVESTALVQPVIQAPSSTRGRSSSGSSQQQQQQQQQQQPQARPQTSSPGNSGRMSGEVRRSGGVSASVRPQSSSRLSGNNVLRAVLALLNELDEDALQVVRSEVESRLYLCSPPVPRHQQFSQSPQQY